MVIIQALHEKLGDQAGRPGWYINRKGSDDIDSAIKGLLEREEDAAEEALRSKSGRKVAQHKRPFDKPQHNYEQVF